MFMHNCSVVRMLEHKEVESVPELTALPGGEV